MITNIGVERLNPHPDNPRKENPTEEPGADETLCDDEFPCDDCIYDEGGQCGYDCGDDGYYCIEGDKRIRRSDE